jgi:DNA modification methylase
MTVQLFCGDCLEIMPTLGKVDAVVTDPPYGIKADSIMAKQAGQQYGKAAAKKRAYLTTDWDNKPASAEIIALCQEIAKSCIIWGGNYFMLPPSSCWLVWDKLNGENNFADCELAWTNLKKAVRIKRHMWNGMIREGNEERFHPTQKPLAVMEWCLSFLPDAVTILDPFMGSGTTGVACVNMGRNFIGIEKDPQYFEIAKERIAEAERRKNNEFFVKKPDSPTLFDFMLEDKQ